MSSKLSVRALDFETADLQPVIYFFAAVLELLDIFLVSLFQLFSPVRSAICLADRRHGQSGSHTL